MYFTFLFQEDFQPTTYGFQLCHDLSETRAVGILKEADEDCQKAVRVSSFFLLLILFYEFIFFQNVKGKSQSDDSQRSVSFLFISKRMIILNFFQIDLIEAISTRVRFLRNLLIAIMALTGNDGKGINAIRDCMTVSFVNFVN